MKSLKRSRGRVLSSLGLTLGLVLFVGAAMASADTLWAVVRYDGSVAAGKNVEFVARDRNLRTRRERQRVEASQRRGLHLAAQELRDVDELSVV